MPSTTYKHLRPQPRIIPQPVSVRVSGGYFDLRSNTAIVAGGEARTEAEGLAMRLRHATGFALPVVDRSPIGTPAIHLFMMPGIFEKEEYRLSVTPFEVRVTASSAAGLFYGGQTLLQLLPPSVYSATPDAGQLWEMPAIEIEDRPRFGWRGAMLDVARHFVPLDFIRKFIDILAVHKMNVLHLHLNDDQGWRIEIKQYPKLTEVGAYRDETVVGACTQDPAAEGFDPANDTFDGIPHGGFYTQEEMREIVDYAAARHITVVPEIDMPGHAQAAIAAYPELGCTPVPLQVSKRWGIHDNILNPFESTLHFMQNVLAEIMSIFPSPYIHIGGDEAVKNYWRRDPACQDCMKQLGLKDEEAMQSYFINRMEEFINAHGRFIIGWDEILEGGLAPNSTVMSWRSEEGGIIAATSGHDAIMTPNEFTYLNHYQHWDRDAEPLAFPGSCVSLEMVYQYDPIPAELPSEYAHHILGSQVQLWSEYMPTTRLVEYMAFPRLSALSEVTWSRREDRCFEDFLQRLDTHFQRLDSLDIAYRPYKSAAELIPCAV